METLKISNVSEILKLLKKRKIDNFDLCTVIAQDYKTNEILMVAYANDEAIRKTFETGKVHYFSTSRKELWLKGETSGHFQYVREIYIDCDGDVILYKIEQIGAACHTGNRSCFFRKIESKT
ncbi:bifunctional protein (Includes: phosphoribosyl-AMP cyclohydrolase; phosphoribosyl-ATP pyrophosphatase) (fragment) [groundwater metagenome]|uniref:Histidine biosynthesis bifunctional protein HisIE n=1 Tax=groundwater metagenome TaxID=717931 RepID=A0A098E847_9ZZZZ